MSKPLLHPILRRGKENLLLPRRNSNAKKTERESSKNVSISRLFGTEITNMQNYNSNSSRQTKPIVIQQNPLESKTTRQYQSLSYERISNNLKITPRMPSPSNALGTSYQNPHMISTMNGNNSNRNSRERLPSISLLQKKEMFQARCEKQIFSKIPKCDKGNLKNIYHCSEYTQDIHSHMQMIEKLTIAQATYMKKQPDLNESMRAVVIDWLIDVHAKFMLLPETLFLTVNLIDRYLSKKQVLKQKLQLVGVASLMISTKYEEIYPPTMNDLVYITDKAYKKDEIITMEQSILQTLDFDIQQTSAYRFLERYSKVSKFDTVEFFASQYLLEIALLDSKMNQFNPSEQAATSIFITLSTLRQDFEWERFEEHSGYSTDQLRNCFKCIKSMVDSIQNSQLQAIFRKYKSPKYLEVARLFKSKQ